jgi:hypothetical protein
VERQRTLSRGARREGFRDHRVRWSQLGRTSQGGRLERSSRCRRASALGGRLHAGQRLWNFFSQF